MAKVLRRAQTGDGYDVRFVADYDGQAYVLHFAKEPDKKALIVALAAFEARLSESESKLMIEAEDGTTV